MTMGLNSNDQIRGGAVRASDEEAGMALSEETPSSSLTRLINQTIWEESDEHRQAIANHQGDGVEAISGYHQNRESYWR